MIDDYLPYTVYEATCVTTRKSYIGITRRTVQARWIGHCSKARTRTTSSPLHRAIAKYGRDAFTVTVIAIAFGRENACVVEREIIADRQTRAPAGYNLAPGGEVGEPTARSAEQRSEISARLKAHYANPEARRLLGERNKGRRASLETRAKMSDAQRRRHAEHPMSAETRAKVAAANSGKTVSSLTRQRISEAQRGRKLTDAHKQKVGDFFRGKPLSPGHRQKISAAHKGRDLGPEWRAKIGEINRNRDPEIHKRISQTLRGRVMPEATKQKLSDASRGRKVTGEQLERLVALCKKNAAKSAGVPIPQERKIRISQSLKARMTDQERARLANFRRGHVKSPETRAKISASVKRTKALRRKGGCDVHAPS